MLIIFERKKERKKKREEKKRRKKKRSSRKFFIYSKSKNVEIDFAERLNDDVRFFYNIFLHVTYIYGVLY